MIDTKLSRIMTTAASQGIVVPAFNIPYLPMIEPIISALKKHDTFALVEVARPEFTKFEAKSPTAAAAEFAKFADPHVTSLHLDHIPVIDEDGMLVDWKSYISEGLACGFSSVMIDGSRLSLEENIKITREVVEMAHAVGVIVEAELGSVMGHETGPMPPYEEILAKKMGFTKPDEAARFVRETGVDWLSVSVGSIHGSISASGMNLAKVAAKLDIEHLIKLRDATGIPLVLHGGSGVQISYVREGIKNGIVKINVCTDIRQPYDRDLATGGPKAAQQATFKAVEQVIVENFGIEGSATRLAV